MTDLRSCYFCGTAEAAEEGPAVPTALDPPAAVQQSVVLCPACREKLTAVLEPVFEHGVGPRRGGDAAPDPGDAATADEVDDGADAGDDAGASGDSMFGVFDAAADAGDVGSDPTPDPPAPDDAADRGANSDEPEGTGGTPVDRIPGAGGGSADDGRDASDPPEEYYTVLRFLENREFPVNRGEIEGTVAAAYDLSEREVGAIVDAAVDRGVLVEVGGTLARSREQL